MENLGYLTFDEAAFLAKVSRGMIYKWMDDGKFFSSEDWKHIQSKKR